MGVLLNAECLVLLLEHHADVYVEGRSICIEDLDPAYAEANMSPEYAEWAGRYVKNAYDATLPEDAPTLDVDICK